MGTHEGWKNYETWCIALWIANEKRLYDRWCAEVAKVKAETPPSEATIVLADRLKEWAQQSRPQRLEGVWADLMSAALSEVDWREIAVDLLGQ